MDEAVEICKLRLFLKLVAQVEEGTQIEPLPDIDFNIKAGNTLVGFTSLEDVRDALSNDKDQYRLLSVEEEEQLLRIEEEAQAADRAFTLFRSEQVEEGTATPSIKAEVRKLLGKLNGELNHALALRYGVTLGGDKYEEWLKGHQPFHWLVDFYGIMSTGGFNVVIGNPPYLELSQVSYRIIGFKSISSKTIHALCIERGLILSKNSNTSMIVPLSIVSTQRMKIIQDILENNKNVWYSNYSWRPGKLFDTVNRALTIYITTNQDNKKVFSTNYQKWTSETRSILIQCIYYSEVGFQPHSSWIPKIGDDIEKSILRKLLQINNQLGNQIVKQGPKIYYRTTGGCIGKFLLTFLQLSK